MPSGTADPKQFPGIKKGLRLANFQGNDSKVQDSLKPSSQIKCKDATGREHRQRRWQVMAAQSTEKEGWARNPVGGSTRLTSRIYDSDSYQSCWQISGLPVWGHIVESHFFAHLNLYVVMWVALADETSKGEEVMYLFEQKFWDSSQPAMLSPLPLREGAFMTRSPERLCWTAISAPQWTCSMSKHAAWLLAASERKGWGGVCYKSITKLILTDTVVLDWPRLSFTHSFLSSLAHWAGGVKGKGFASQPYPFGRPLALLGSRFLGLWKSLE